MIFLDTTDCWVLFFDPVCHPMSFNWRMKAINIGRYNWVVLTIYYRCLFICWCIVCFSFPDIFVDFYPLTSLVSSVFSCVHFIISDKNIFKYFLLFITCISFELFFHRHILFLYLFWRIRLLNKYIWARRCLLLGFAVLHSKLIWLSGYVLRGLLRGLLWF